MSNNGTKSWIGSSLCCVIYVNCEHNCILHWCIVINTPVLLAFGCCFYLWLNIVYAQTDLHGFLPEEPTPKASDMLECAAYDCPQILRKGIVIILWYCEHVLVVVQATLCRQLGSTCSLCMLCLYGGKWKVRVCVCVCVCVCVRIHACVCMFQGGMGMGKLVTCVNHGFPCTFQILQICFLTVTQWKGRLRS